MEPTMIRRFAVALAAIVAPTSERSGYIVASS
jgi:hypothetical protein